MAITRFSSKDEILRGYESFKKKAAAAKEYAEERAGIIIQSGLTVGTAFGMGWARGRWDEGVEDDFTFIGVPVDLGLGLAGHLLAFMGVFGKWGDNIHAVSNGALSAYAVVQGLEMGAESQEENRQEDAAAGRFDHAPYNNLPHGMPMGYGFGPAANQYGFAHAAA